MDSRTADLDRELAGCAAAREVTYRSRFIRSLAASQAWLDSAREGDGATGED